MGETRAARSSVALSVLIVGHSCVDLSAGALFALLPFLVAERQYTYAAVGAFALTANVASGVCQPLFGAGGDRREARWLLPLGLVLAGLGVGVVGLTTRYPVTLIAVVVCMVGVAAYHPEAARWARLTAGSRVEARMSFFSVGGGIGYALGPLLVAAVLALAGLQGTVIVGVIPFVAAGGVLLGMRHFRETAPIVVRGSTTGSSARSEWRPFGLLVAMFCISSAVGTGLMIYLPVYLVEARNTSPAASNIMSSILMGAGAVGMVLGGLAAQRLSRRLVLVAPQLLLAPAIALLPSLNYATMIPVTALAGLTVMANFSLAIVLGQEYLPAHMGLAAGLLNGFCTAVAGLVLYGLGVLGDVAGPVWVIYVLALLPLAVAASSLFLRCPAAAPAQTRWGLRPGLEVDP